MLACEQDNLEVVEILLEHNAGTEIQTLVHILAIVAMMYIQKLNFNHNYHNVYIGWLDSSDDSLC